ncbi:hypothetical protein DI09_22p230 [Mitosporidium daphniae]|uniref:Ribosomal protein L10 n=1 Tax=Mitosporidium daphniae TaxID=1485682 RepID=A0A098VSE2_9MICR|nr:uncharacterized protein DI09_22p230 [Mitosporidium daphniae]KGG51998.1 hypothetical protein DI09_22p230 [Mitosporidium daphniae]|eukprot:XP_013238425.1 uncharacterized protein DI09_22p230 [Mitosporidium daphniae]
MEIGQAFHWRWFGTRARLAPLKKIMEFRQGPFSALRPPDAPKPPEVLPLPAKVRIAQADAIEAVSCRHLFIMQNISISSVALHKLKLKINEISAFKIKMIPPAILTKALWNDSPKTKEQDLSWIAGPTFVAYGNETNPLKARSTLLALKAEPFVAVLGGRFEETLFTHEGLNDLFQKLPGSKEPLHLELVSLLTGAPYCFTDVLSSPPMALFCTLKRLETQLTNKEI